MEREQHSERLRITVKSNRRTKISIVFFPHFWRGMEGRNISCLGKQEGNIYNAYSFSYMF